MSTRKFAPQKIIYCSFCGKSQEEVRRIVAAESTFICNECIKLCSDIVEEEDRVPQQLDHDRYACTVAVYFPDNLDEMEIDLLPKFVSAVQELMPGCKLALSSFAKRVDGDRLVLDVEAPSTIDVVNLRAQIDELTQKLRIMQSKYLVERKNRDILERKMSSIYEDVYPILIKQYKAESGISGVYHKNLTVLFLDIVGFSAMDEEGRSNTVDALRSIARVVIRGAGGLYVNTWGDAIVAGFESPTSGLLCACRFIRHLDVMGIDARIGVSWGAARVALNEATGRLDIDGDSVNFGARLETLAAPQSVLCASEIMHLDEFDKSHFNFSEREVVLKKGAGDLAAGTTVTAYEVSLAVNR